VSKPCQAITRRLAPCFARQSELWRTLESLATATTGDLTGWTMRKGKLSGPLDIRRGVLYRLTTCSLGLLVLLCYGRKIAAPAIRQLQPRAKSAPRIQVLTSIKYRCSIGLPYRYCVSPNFNRHVTRTINAKGFETQILVTEVSEFLQKMLDR
jgi:hypothetical protein